MKAYKIICVIFIVFFSLQAFSQEIENDSNVIKFRKEIDFFESFGPIDIAILNVYGHNNIVGGTVYEPYLYLLDHLSPKAVYLLEVTIPNNTQGVLKS